MKIKVVLLIVCVILAGCSTVDTGTTPTATPDDGVDSEPTPTATPDDGVDSEPTPTATPDSDTDSGATPTVGETTSLQLYSSPSLPDGFVSNHKRVLRAQGDYTSISNYTFGSADFNLNYTIRVDTQDREELILLEEPLGNITALYVIQDQVYTKYENGTVNQSQRESEFEATDTPTETMADLNTSANWTRAGEDQLRGTTVVRYTSSDPNAVYRVLNESSPDNVTDVRAEVLIDERKIVRSVYVKATVNTSFTTYTTTYQIRITDVGTTNLERPTWAE